MVKIILVLLICGFSSVSASVSLSGTTIPSSHICAMLQIKISCRPDPWKVDNCIQKNGSYRQETRTCYVLVKVHKNWYSALDHCRSIGFDLASIHDEDANKFLSKLAGGYGGGLDHWIGGMKDRKGTWSWSDGSPWDYENWGQGQGKGYETIHAEMVKGGGWEDEDNHDQNFICQQATLEALLSRNENCLTLGDGLDSVNVTGNRECYPNNKLDHSSLFLRCVAQSGLHFYFQ